jgi:hypothetical protein
LHQLGQLNTEQQPMEYNPLFSLAICHTPQDTIDPQD